MGLQERHGCRWRAQATLVASGPRLQHRRVMFGQYRGACSRPGQTTLDAGRASSVAIWAAVVVALGGCHATPAETARLPWLADAWSSPAAAYNKGLDGAAAAVDSDAVGPSDTAAGGGSDSGPSPTDASTPDSSAADGSAADSITPPPQWPSGSLLLVSAFSPDGKAIKLRFNKPVDPSSVGSATSYTLLENNQVKAGVILGAKADADPQFVALTLAPGFAPTAGLGYEVQVKGLKGFDGQGLPAAALQNKKPVKRTAYVHILWHQHQPTYLDPIADQLTSPWVRKHSMKSYYDMASVLLGYPKVHLSMNLTPVLLNQLIPYYLDRLGEKGADGKELYVDTQKNTVDESKFLAKWQGRTDPWIDLLLQDTPEPKAATAKQIGLLYADPWSCVSTSPVLMNRFPAYAALRDKNPATLTREDLAALKVWFEIAWMDPDFLHGAVKLATGDVVNLTDVIAASAPQNATFTLKMPGGLDAAGRIAFYEQLANRLVAEQYKIMKAIIPLHKQMHYDPDQHTGQIEITTTPFYHPILPLVHNSELMAKGQPFDPRPAPSYAYAADAAAQVQRAVAYMEQVFGFKPRGMWPGEGSVAEEVVQHFVQAGVLWVATDQQVMEKSGLWPGGAPVSPFVVDTDKATSGSGDGQGRLGVFFRNTDMSNDIGFKYQGLTGQQATDDLVANVQAQAPKFGAPDRVISLILDGENAWETFSKEHDGKGFFHALYARLQQLEDAGEIVTVSGSEYLLGNPKRNVPPHPLASLPPLEPLFAGSWIGGNFGIWIGETEENTGWQYLAQARADLAKSGLTAPDPLAPPPQSKTSLAGEIWYAFDEIYAAEGSDWFWWYGSDMTSPSNDDSPFDNSFRLHLAGMYKHMNAALKLQGKAPLAVPTFKPIIQANPQVPQGPLVPPPGLDGVFTPSEVEWSTKGGFFFDSDTAGALANPDDWIATVYYGFGQFGSKAGLFLAVQHTFDLGTASGGLGVYLSSKQIVNAATGEAIEAPATLQSRLGDKLGFAGKGAARELWVGLSGGKTSVEWRKWTAQASSWTALAPSPFGGQVAGPVKNGKIIEMFIPYEDLAIKEGDPLQLQLVFGHAGKSADLAPSLDAKALVDDPTAAVFVTFVCDVSEKSGISLTSYGDLCNQPAPKGKGIVYIAGNHPSLGMKAKWVPNKVALRDDGLEGDAKAGDGLWTRVVQLPRGTALKYKYTVGITMHEGQWACTEEFPLTERGLEVTKNPATKKLLVQDIFADRPTPTGTLGPKTVVTEQ
jgi:alpha-amylase/alpha-mannosidase (GH57 family)